MSTWAVMASVKWQWEFLMFEIMPKNVKIVGDLRRTHLKKRICLLTLYFMIKRRSALVLTNKLYFVML